MRDAAEEWEASIKEFDDRAAAPEKYTRPCVACGKPTTSRYFGEPCCPTYKSRKCRDEIAVVMGFE